MSLIPLPDLAVLRICHHLPIADVIRLKGEDLRVHEYYRMLTRNAQIIKHRWLTMKTRGRNYFRDILVSDSINFDVGLNSTWYRACQLMMLKTKIKDLNHHADLIRYHTIFPRKRVVIPRRELWQRKYSIETSSYISEIQTYPSTKVDIVTSGRNFDSRIVLKDVGKDAVIPMTLMPLERIEIILTGDDELPMYLCYTEIQIPVELLRLQLQNIPLYNLNVDAIVDVNMFLKKAKSRMKVNPNLFPIS